MSSPTPSDRLTIGAMSDMGVPCASTAVELPLPVVRNYMLWRVHCAWCLDYCGDCWRAKCSRVRRPSGAACMHGVQGDFLAGVPSAAVPGAAACYVIHHCLHNWPDGDVL